jgi:SAM-dependent methyltransferase
VVDLGCGNGEFVEMLRERGVDARGVDADAEMVRRLRARGTPVVEQDVLAYMAERPAESVDGVFAGHLVEHLPYATLLALLRDTYRALTPGGVIVLATPDPRSLYAHLEMYHRHFGHVSFYDPRLLCFFLTEAGFGSTEWGSNPSPVHPASPLFGAHRIEALGLRPPLQKRNLLHRMVQGLRTAWAYLLLRPYLDRIDANLRALAERLDAIDRPFECYAVGRKQAADERSPST